MVQINHVVQRVNKMKDKNPMIISVWAEQVFDKFWHPFYDEKNSQETERRHLDIIRAMQDRPAADVTLSGEKLKASP